MSLSFTTTSHPIVKPHILFGRKALQATLPKTGTQRLPFAYNVKRRSSVFMSPTNGNQYVKKPVISCAVSLPTHSLFYFLCSCYNHILLQPVLSHRIIFRKGTSWLASVKSGIRRLLSKNLPLYVPYRVYFSFPICL